MKLKRILLSLILVAALPFTMKVSAKGKLSLLTTKNSVLMVNPQDPNSYIEINKKFGDYVPYGILIKFNEENKTPEISNVIYLQIFSKLMTNIFIDNIKEKNDVDLSEFKIKDYANVDLNNVLFAFISALEQKNGQQPTSEDFKKLVNSKNWDFYLSNDVAKKLREKQLFVKIGEYLGYIIAKGLDKTYKEDFQPKIEECIDKGILDKILDGIILKYNELKEKPEFKENSNLFEEKHPEYPKGFIEKIKEIKNSSKEEQKKHFEEILYKMSFETVKI